MESVNKIQAWIIDQVTGQLVQYLVGIMKPGACRLPFQPDRCNQCQPYVDFRSEKTTTPPACIEPLVSYIREGRDLSAELPINFTIPNLGPLKWAIRQFMANTNRPVLYEQIRVNLQALFLPHSVLLGGVSGQSFYNSNMERMAQKILSQLAGKKEGTELKDDDNGRQGRAGSGGSGDRRGGNIPDSQVHDWSQPGPADNSTGQDLLEM